MTGIPVLQANTDPTVVSRPVSVVVTSNPTPQVIDMIVPTASFICQPGDICVVTPTGSKNAAGIVGPAGAPFTATAPGGTPPPPPPAGPSAEVVTTINFTT